MEYVPYEQFINIKFIAEGGFSKIYKATWIDGPVISYNNKEDDIRSENYTVVLKKINDSKNITSKELNELKVFYDFSSEIIKKNSVYTYRNYRNNNVGKYFGTTQDPNSQDIMIIMPYYDSGDLIHYITKDFFNIDWFMKLSKLRSIALGLNQIHELNIIHRDFHSGNIFFNDQGNYFIDSKVIIGDLGISKSAAESGDDNENYDVELSYSKFGNQTKIAESSDIGPVIKNNLGAIYKSRPLSAMINSAMSLRSPKSLSINLGTGKRKFEDLITDNDDDG
ncbi:unnamed protein product [Rhizophagus irregularis]|nr:unnamed protein product [Rhizophagus irregularis]